MAMVINTNIASLNAQRNLSRTQGSLNTSLQRLSSGLRINSAKDDAAGLSIVTRFAAQVKGMNQAVRNANDGISLAQTGEGAIQEVTTNLQRIRELAVQSANGSYSATDRLSMQKEVDQLVAEIDRIATKTQFSGRNILDGSSGTLAFQVGANANETISVSNVNVRTNSLGQQAGINQSTTDRMSLTDDGTDDVSIGIQEDTAGTGKGAELGEAGGEFKITVAGTTSVDISAASFGGAITGTTTSNLKDVNNAEYGSGMAKSIAERINNIREMELDDTNAGADGTYLEGVYASAKTTFKSSDLNADDYSGSAVSASDYSYVGAGSLKNGDLNINGVDIGAVSFQEKDATGTLSTAINAKSDVTGVTASVDENGELVLTAEDGRDIVVNTTTSTATNNLFSAGGSSQTSGAADFTAKLENLRVTGQVTVTAQETITLAETNADEFGVGASQGSLKEKNVQAVGTIANADVKTAAGANVTIESVDSALEQISSIRADFGAVQNRFESVVRNLQNVSENLSASRSRIEDADFAMETASLTRAQIMQQAGTAMLAQANMLPQQALSLLG